MNRFRRFMYGRYGFDQLTSTLILFSLLITLIASFSGFRLLILVSYLLIAYAVYRFASKNITKRTQENFTFMRMTGSLRKGFNNIKLSLVGTKTHKYYRCRHCRQMIRVPRGKGKICITCPKCKAEFVRRT